MSEIIVFQVGEVCARDCEFSNDGVRGQCLGKDSGRDHSFSCDYDALVALYKRGTDSKRK